uniref:Uncharacterized protein n=1 Tax=Picea glauca TaxID=3330 RepID=A0A101M432_PICGL|nr:hypothetical protein ABT39_MTgene578 [Picea glauca]
MNGNSRVVALCLFDSRAGASWFMKCMPAVCNWRMRLLQSFSVSPFASVRISFPADSMHAYCVCRGLISFPADSMHAYCVGSVGMNTLYLYLFISLPGPFLIHSSSRTTFPLLILSSSDQFCSFF